MRWCDEITLIAVEYPAERVNANGFPAEPTETPATVYGNKKSAGYSEFYKAAQAGFQTELKFDVFAEEYSGQPFAEVGGVRYKILRTYNDPKRPDEIELTLSDITELQEAAEGGGEVGTI